MLIIEVTNAREVVRQRIGRLGERLIGRVVDPEAQVEKALIQELETAFKAAKAHIVGAVKEGLTTFQLGRITALTTDWSNTGLAYALLQKTCVCSEKKEDGLRSPLTASLEPLFVRPELRLGRLLVAARAADGQRREDGALEELAAGRLAFDGVLEPCAGQLAISCHLVSSRVISNPARAKARCAATKREELRWRSCASS